MEIEMNKEDGTTNETNWSDLPIDIQEIILTEVVVPEDAIRLSLTCKSFREYYTRCRAFCPEIASPHLMLGFDQLYEPNDNKLYPLGDIEPVPPSSTLQYSNHGWLLMTEMDDYIFFYNLINGAMDYLPDLPQEDYRFTVYHFTAPPTSDKCKVICVNQVITNIRIGLIARGQEEWDIHEHTLAKHLDYRLAESHPVLMKGVLYCLGKCGDIMAIDLRTKIFGFTRLRRDLRRKLEATYVDGYLVDNDGELLCVFVSRDGRWVSSYRLNMKSMKLEKVYTLENNVLYLSRHGCFSKKVTNGNKIYIPMSYDGFCLYYSLETRKFHTIDGYCTTSFENGPEGYNNPAVWIKPISTDIRDTEWEW